MNALKNIKKQRFKLSSKATIHFKSKGSELRKWNCLLKSATGDFICSSLWSWSPAIGSNFCGSVCNKWLLAIFNELWQILITDFECLSQQSKSLVKLPLQEWADLTIFADDQNLPDEHIKLPTVLLASCSLGIQSNLLSEITATYYSSQQTEKSTVFFAILRVMFLMLQVFFKWIRWYAPMHNVPFFSIVRQFFWSHRQGLRLTVTNQSWVVKIQFWIAGFLLLLVILAIENFWALEHQTETN